MTKRETSSGEATARLSPRSGADAPGSSEATDVLVRAAAGASGVEPLEASVRMLVDAAAMVDSGERSAFLDRECGNDLELRRLVQERLDALAAVDTGEAPSSSRDAPAARIGPYEVLGLLGTGGMGTVVRARHGESGELVALKSVRAPRAELLSSLRREIHALARLRHPGIVRILDQGVHEGVPWYAMEMLDGEPLAARVPIATPPRATAAQVSAALALVRRLCEPLAYLHGEGMVHRDLKPANVQLRGDGVVLVDFGLAWIFGGGRERLGRGDPHGGTPSYMAPEQIVGRTVDARADIYALGCILYELLTGRPPFRDPRSQEIVRMHLHAQPEPPSRVVPGIPPEVDALVLRLLAKEPRARIGHADDVAARLALLGASDPAPPRPASRAYLYQPELVGRGRLVGSIAARIGALGVDGGGILLLSAESGAGKTRVLAECVADARLRGHLVLTGECLAEGGRPLEPLVEPLLALGDACREQGRDAGARWFAPYLPLLAPYVPSLAELVGIAHVEPPAALAPDAARLRLFGALAELLGSAERPAVLVLDDLQWGDDLTLGFLVHLLRTPHLARLLVLGAFRADEAPEALLALTRQPGVEVAGLDGLDPRGVSEMVAGMLAIEQTPGHFGAFLAERSEGNPFFVAEYLRLAVDEGLLRRDAHGAWRLFEASVDATGVGRLPLLLPASLGDLLDLRLRRLGAGARLLAGCAAIVGREVEPPVLAHMARLPASAFLDAVTELLLRHVMAESPSGYRFTHDRLREAALDAIPSQELVERHRLAGEALEALFTEGVPDVAASRLARHWERAGERERAAGWYRRAAVHAEARYAIDEAEAAQRGRLATAGGGAEAIAARNALGHVLLLRGRTAEAASELELALEDARRIGDRTLEAEGLCELATIRAFTGRVAEGEALLAEALELTRELGAVETENRCLHQLARLAQSRGKLHESGELARRGIARARENGRPALERRWEATLASSLIELGRLDEARAILERLRAWARREAELELEVVATHDLATIETLENHPEVALVLLGEALAAARRAGDRSGELRYSLNVGVIQYISGERPAARRTYEAALGLAREIGDVRQRGYAHLGLGNVLHVIGEPVEARSHLESALTIAREMGDRYLEATALDNLAQNDREAGRIAEARAEVGDAIRIAAAAGYRDLLGWCLGSSCLVALLEGDVAGALEAGVEGERILREDDVEHELAQVACIVAHAELAAGRSPAARLEEVRLMASRGGARPGSVLGDALGRLERAVAAAARGEGLVAGFLPGDLTDAERRSIARRGEGAGGAGA